jgi:hypothetical protein
MVDEDAEVHPEESGQECQRQEKCGDDRQDVDELTLPVSDIGGVVVERVLRLLAVVPG